MASAESGYVYFCHEDGIFCVKIPDDHKKMESEELELVWDETSSINIVMDTMGMFTDGRLVYLVGGKYFGLPITYNTQTIHIFNPSSIPAEEEMTSVSTSKYTPMMKPNIFRVKERNYLFSLFESNQLKPFFSFQSFDSTEKCFHHLNTPDLSIDNPRSTFVVGHFIVLDHIYLFIKESQDFGIRPQSPTWTHFAFSFDTRSSSSATKWEKLDSLCSTFVDQKIPFPYKHNGNTGLSVEFSGNNRILIALVSGKPTAYRVSVDEAGGSLQLVSHRLLVDFSSSLHGIGRHLLCEDTMSHLLDLGDQKFCVVYCSQDAPLVVYIFKMDFEFEYYRNSSCTTKKSTVILSSKKFKHNMSVFRIDRPSSACLAFSSAPPSSHENVEVYHSKQHDEPVKKEEDDDYGVAYVEDFDEMDLAEQREDELV